MERLKPDDQSICLLGPILGQFFKYQSAQSKNEKGFMYQPYQIVIPRAEHKVIKILSIFNNSYTHVFGDLNPGVFYENTDPFEKMFCLTLKQNYRYIVQVDTELLRKKMNKKTNMVQLDNQILMKK